MRRGYSNDFSKSVETYCFHENKWTQLPYMLKEKCFHSTVSIGNKLFVIDGFFNDGCEVFDSITNKFISIKKIHMYLTMTVIRYKLMLSLLVIKCMYL